MSFELPTSLEVCGVEYQIRWDFRAVLDCCIALSDPELNEQDKAEAILAIFYPEFPDMPPEHYREAIERCFWFINCEDEEKQTRKTPRLVDWEQDFQYIVAPINRVLGKEIRAEKELHWWSFISAYCEIGDCTFAQIVRIRDRKARNKPLDKQDREWYNQNRHLVDFKQKYTDNEKKVLEQWGI